MRVLESKQAAPGSIVARAAESWQQLLGVLESKPAEHGIGIRKPVIDFACDVILICSIYPLTDELSRPIGAIGLVREWINCQIRQNLRIDRNGCTLDNSVACLHSRDVEACGHAARLPHSFVVSEKECPVCDNRTTKGKAELIPSKFRLAAGLLPVEEVPGIEVVITQKFKYGTMEVIRARLGNGAHDGSRVFSIFGVICIGHDPEFRHCFDARHRSSSAAAACVAGVVDVRSIQKKTVGRRARTYDGKLLGESLGDQSSVGRPCFLKHCAGL